MHALVLKKRFFFPFRHIQVFKIHSWVLSFSMPLHVEVPLYPNNYKCVPFYARVSSHEEETMRRR